MRSDGRWIDGGEVINIDLPRGKIEAFCRRWRITEFALFGSVLTDDFHRDSDVDVLVTFAPDARHSLFDRMDMIEELKEMFGREVDLADRSGLVNPYIRRHVLANHRVVYAVGGASGGGSQA